MGESFGSEQFFELASLKRDCDLIAKVALERASIKDLLSWENRIAFLAIKPTNTGSLASSTA